MLKIEMLVLCPKCGSELTHINALNSEAKMYIVYCKNNNCGFTKDYYIKSKVIIKCH